MMHLGDWMIELEIDYGADDDLLCLEIQMNYSNRLRSPAEFNAIVNRHIKRQVKAFKEGCC